MAEALIATATGEFGTSFLAKEATKVGIKQFIQTYGSTAFQRISPVIIGGIIAAKVVDAYPPVDLQKEKLFGMPISHIIGQGEVYSDIEEPTKVKPLEYIPEIHGGKPLPPIEQESFPAKTEVEPVQEGFKAPEKIETTKGLEISPQEIKMPPGIQKAEPLGTDILTKDIKKQTKDLVTEKPEFGALTEDEKQAALLEKGDKPDYYSRVARAVEGSQDIATAEQWMGIILGQGATKVELDYLGLTELLKGDKKITKADLLSQIKEKDLSSRITTTLIPKKDMGVILYPEYDLGGHGASNDTRVYVMQYDVTKDTEGKYLPHDEPIEYHAPAVHIGKEQYGRNTLATLRVQVGYEGIKELEDLFILSEGQSDLVQKIQKEGTAKEWVILKGSDITKEFVNENYEGTHELREITGLAGEEGLIEGTAMYTWDATRDKMVPYRRIESDKYYTFSKDKMRSYSSKSIEEAEKNKATWAEAVEDFPIKDSRKIAELMVNEFITQAILSGADSIGFANGAILHDRYTGQDPDKAESLAFWQDKMLISSAEKILKRWIKKSGWNEPLESLITEYDIETGTDLQKRDILPTMDELGREDYFLETVTAKDLLDYIVKNLDSDFEDRQEIPDFISLLDEGGLGVAGDNVVQKLKSIVDAEHGDTEFMVYQNEAGNFNFRLPIINKSAAEFYYKDNVEAGLPEWAKKRAIKSEYERKAIVYSKYVEDYKTETSYKRHKIIKMKLPKSLQEQFISESQKFTKLDKQKLPIEDQTQRLFA